MKCTWGSVGFSESLRTFNYSDIGVQCTTENLCQVPNWSTLIPKTQMSKTASVLNRETWGKQGTQHVSSNNNSESWTDLRAWINLLRDSPWEETEQYPQSLSNIIIDTKTRHVISLYHLHLCSNESAPGMSLTLGWVWPGDVCRCTQITTTWIWTLEATYPRNPTYLLPGKIKKLF